MKRKNKIIPKNSEELKEAIFKAAFDAIISIDAQGKIIEFNPAAEKMFGYSYSEAIGREMAELIIPLQYRNKHRNGLKNYLKTGEETVLNKRIRITALRSDGSEFPVELSIIRIGEENPPVFTGFIRDISEEKILQEELIKHHEQLGELVKERTIQLEAAQRKIEGLLNFSPDAIVAVNQKGIIVLVNNQTENLFGYKRNELIGSKLEILLPERFKNLHVEHRFSYFNSPRLREMGTGLELYARRKDGSEFPVEISLSPFETEEGIVAISAIRDITERKKAEEERKKIQERMEEVLNFTPDAIVAVNHNGNIVLVNHQTENLFGYQRDELIGSKLEMLLPNRFGNLHIEHRASYFQFPRIREMGAGFELYAKRKDGTEFPVEISLSPIETKEGIVAISAIRDITERKRVEEERKKIQKRMEDLLNFTPDAIVAVNQKGDIVLINNQAENLFGYTRRELIGSKLEVLLPDRFSKQHVKHRSSYFHSPRVREMGAGLELFGKRKDGGEFPVEISLSPFETEEGTVAISAIRDITDRKQAENEIQKQKQDMRDFIDSMSTFTAKIATDGTILMINKIARQALGLTKEKLHETNFFEGDWWAFDLEVLKRVRKSFNKACSGIAINYDENILVFNQVLIINFSIIPIFETGGKVSYLVAEGRDITPLKKAEAALKDRTSQLKSLNNELEGLNKKLKDFDELKTSFFTNVSHELRTPLALIMGPVEKLLSQNDIPVYYEKDLKVIQQNAKILLKHVNNLLDLSKLEVGKMDINYSEIDLAHLVKVTASYFELLANEKQIYLNVDVPENLQVHADTEKIERILINLLSNAFKFTPVKGTISCVLTQQDSIVTFEVEDSGPGIKPELMKTIFERFTQSEKGLARHLGSTGLGLSIAKEFIELHNGKIEVKNSKTGGAVFSFTIPLTAPPGAFVQRKMEVNEEELKSNIETYQISDLEPDIYKDKKKQHKKPAGKIFPVILVIEDNREMNRFIFETLSDNYKVISAYDGEEGLQMAALYKPDMIITDIMMPKLSGDIVVQKLKSNPQLENIPVIILTAKTDEELKITLLKKGVQDYISKPFTVEELKARVNNIIRMKLIKDRLQSELQSHSEDISTLVDEIAERKNIIESSLQEKEVLLMEIHHRVKNNLQIISSLLSLQSSSIKDEESYEAFRESQNRIRSMALIHEKLYQSKNLLQINLEDYINDLVANLYNSYNLNAGYLSLKIQIKNIYFSVDIAISLGLIINELISNALKHAFKDSKLTSGEIQILLDSLDKNRYSLVVKDNGKGLPEDFSLHDSQTLGLRLVNSLVNQIEGDIEVNSIEGTEFRITFQTSANGV